MVRIRTVRPFRTLFAWFSHGNRLTALIVVTATIAVIALGYAFANDRSQSAAEDRAEEDRAAFYDCVPKYVSDLSRTNLPRTIASIRASNARFNWDVGHDDEHPTWDKTELKAEYVRLYRAYQAVIVTNPPLPAFSAQYCSASPTPLETPSTAQSEPEPSPSDDDSTDASSPAANRAQDANGAQSKAGPGKRTTPRGTARPSTSAPTDPTLTGDLLPGAQALLCTALPLFCGLQLP